jgi:hypothetical protein
VYPLTARTWGTTCPTGAATATASTSYLSQASLSARTEARQQTKSSREKESSFSKMFADGRSGFAPGARRQGGRARGRASSSQPLHPYPCGAIEGERESEQEGEREGGVGGGGGGGRERERDSRCIEGESDIV